MELASPPQGNGPSQFILQTAMSQSMYHLSPGRLVGSEEGWTDNVGAYEGSMLFASDGSELVVRLAVGAADSDGTIVGTPVGSRLGEVEPAILGENEGTPLVEG